MCLIDTELYKKYKAKKHKVYAVREGLTPTYFVTEPDLVRDILVRDFSQLPNHRFIPTEPCFESNLFNARVEDWKRIRSIVSPAFTSSKLQQLASEIDLCADTFMANIAKVSSPGQSFNVQDYFGSFALDVLTSCAYGTKVESLSNPDHPMIVHAKALLKPNSRLIAGVLFASWFSALNISAAPRSTIDFWKNLTKQLVDERRTNINEKKCNDFLQLLLKSEVESEENGKQLKTLTLNEIVGQGIAFFIGGYETTSTTLSYCSYLLATNPEVQEKLFEEVSKHKELNYESIEDLSFLECCINETLRLFPPLARTEREVKTDYVLGDTGVTIPAGSLVVIPTFAMQRDPEYFENPEMFIPERFSKDFNGLMHHPYAYHPFGGGPRLCIGKRFGMYEIKLCLARLISHYQFRAVPETKIEFCVGTITTCPKEMRLIVERRQKL